MTDVNSGSGRGLQPGRVVAAIEPMPDCPPWCQVGDGHKADGRTRIHMIEVAQVFRGDPAEVAVTVDVIRADVWTGGRWIEGGPRVMVRGRGYGPGVPDSELPELQPMTAAEAYRAARIFELVRAADLGGTLREAADMIEGQGDYE